MKKKKQLKLVLSCFYAKEGTETLINNFNLHPGYTGC